MHRRWSQKVKQGLPTVDSADIPEAYSIEFSYDKPTEPLMVSSESQQKNQFAPEYSQMIY